jgi:putative transposase
MKKKTSEAPESTRKDFDFNEFEKQAIDSLKQGKPLEGKDGILAPLIQRWVEASLEGELDAHLKQTTVPNRRNGKIGKKVKTGFGPVNINTPRDRNSTFAPQILPKRQTTLGEALDNKVISMYSHGMSYNDICTHLDELYGLTVSPSTLSAITDRVIEDIKQWHSRMLESVYPMVWLDAIHFKVKDQGAIITKAVYCVIGINRQGVKDLLGLYIGERESARFWLNVLSDLQSRGVKDILIACIDNLSGFSNAIESIFPQTEVQLCIIHQIRNSTKYVVSKDHKQVMSDMKEVYQAANIEQAEQALKTMEINWNEKYPYMIRSWKNNWLLLSTFYRYPKDIRRVMYTTNIIESFHSQLRKITKTKRIFSSDQSLLKLIYLVYQNKKEGWQSSINGWKLTYSQMMIIFEDRMSQP